MTVLITLMTGFIIKTDFPFKLPVYIFFVCIWMLSYAIYVPLCHYFWGRTLGKYLLKLKLMSADETTLSLKSAFYRELLWIPYMVLPVYHECFVLFLIFTGVITDVSGTHDVFLRYHPNYKWVSTSVTVYELFFILISLFVAFSDKEGRTLHDFIAGTKVVHAK